MSDKNFTQRFDVVMTSLSSDKKITVQQCYICGERCDCSLTYLFKQIVITKDPLVPPQLPVNEDTVHRVVLPFKDQTSADVVICAMQSMSGIPAGICTNVSMNTGSPQSERI